MRLFCLFSAALILTVALMACNSNDLAKLKSKSAGTSSTPAQPAQPPGDGVRRVTPAELSAELASGKAIVVDVRSEMAFKEAHIKGARLIPVNEVLAKSGELPRDKLIVTYCS
ncbi:MAG: rhodanese-like domain-containing protein [Pyrinomonadaceae bacterium]